MSPSNANGGGVYQRFALIESIETTGFWENIVTRVEDGVPEIAYGHHRLAALRKVYPSVKEFDWIVQELTDGQMLQLMARENMESQGKDPNVMRGTIAAAVKAHGEGRIKPEEMPFKKEQGKRSDVIRNAPSYSTDRSEDAASLLHPYTVQGLAKFLGAVHPDGTPLPSFEACFGALELISEGLLGEARIKDLPFWKLGEVVATVKQERAKKFAEAKRLAEEAKRKAEEAARKAEELKRQQAEAEVRRKAVEEAAKKAAAERAEAERAGVHFLIHELVIDPGGVVLEDRGVVAEVVAGQLDASHAKEQNT